MKVLAVLIILVALVIIIVPQYTNCEAGKDDAATSVSDSSTATTMPYRMMKCYWTARAEIVAGVPLIAVGVLLYFARRKETTRALGILAALLGVLTILLGTSIIGTCLNDRMVCNTEMKPVLLICGGITVALGVAAVVLGEIRRDEGAGGPTPA